MVNNNGRARRMAWVYVSLSERMALIKVSLSTKSSSRLLSIFYYLHYNIACPLVQLDRLVKLLLTIEFKNSKKNIWATMNVNDSRKCLVKTSPAH